MAQDQADVSELAAQLRICMLCDYLFQKWSEDRLLRDKEATALAEEDYELAEKLSRQLDATGMKPEGIIFSAGLMEVWDFASGPKVRCFNVQISKWVRECSKEMENEVTFQKEMETKLSALRVCVSVSQYCIMCPTYCMCVLLCVLLYVCPTVCVSYSVCPILCVS